MRPEVRAGIPAVAYQRKARNRCNHFIDSAPTTLSKMLSSTRPRDGRGVEGQRRRFERAKNGLKPDCSRVGRFLQWASNSNAPSVASSVAVRSIAFPRTCKRRFLPLGTTRRCRQAHTVPGTAALGGHVARCRGCRLGCQRWTGTPGLAFRARPNSVCVRRANVRASVPGSPKDADDGAGAARCC